MDETAGLDTAVEVKPYNGRKEVRMAALQMGEAGLVAVVTGKMKVALLYSLLVTQNDEDKGL